MGKIQKQKNKNKKYFHTMLNLFFFRGRFEVNIIKKFSTAVDDIFKINLVE